MNTQPPSSLPIPSGDYEIGQRSFGIIIGRKHSPEEAQRLAEERTKHTLEHPPPPPPEAHKCEQPPLEEID